MMKRVLEQAIVEVTRLSNSDQELIGGLLLSHIEKLRLLRVYIDNGIRSLNAGEGSELRIEEFIQHKSKQHKSKQYGGA